MEIAECRVVALNTSIKAEQKKRCTFSPAGRRNLANGWFSGSEKLTLPVNPALLISFAPLGQRHHHPSDTITTLACIFL
jgi:hypothetical protein